MLSCDSPPHRHAHRYAHVLYRSWWLLAIIAGAPSQVAELWVPSRVLVAKPDNNFLSLTSPRNTPTTYSPHSRALAGDLCILASSLQLLHKSRVVAACAYLVELLHKSILPPSRDPSRDPRFPISLYLQRFSTSRRLVGDSPNAYSRMAVNEFPPSFRIPTKKKRFLQWIGNVRGCTVIQRTTT